MTPVIISFLTLTIFFNSIEFSSQSGNGGNGGGNAGNEGNAGNNEGNVSVPPGRYFEITQGGVQTLINHPGVNPIFENGFLIGIQENGQNCVIRRNGVPIAIRLMTEQIYRLTDVVQIETLRLFRLKPCRPRPHHPDRGSRNSGGRGQRH